MQELIRQLLAGLGEDPEREGLVSTPKRVEKALAFLTSGYRANIDEVLAWAKKAAIACDVAGEVRELLFYPAPE